MKKSEDGGGRRYLSVLFWFHDATYQVRVNARSRCSLGWATQVGIYVFVNLISQNVPALKVTRSEQEKRH